MGADVIRRLVTMRRTLPILTVGLAVAVPAPVAPAPASATAEGLVIAGRGYGHGVGLPQDGALALAQGGADVGTILDTFYPGTSLGSRGGTVRADVLDQATSSVLIGFPSGGELAEAGTGAAPGFPITVSPGGSVRVSFDGGSFSASPLDGATAALVTAPEAPTPSASASAAAAGEPGPTTSTTLATLLGLIPLPPPSTPSTTAPPPATTVPPAATTEPETPSEPATSRPLRAVPSGAGSVDLPELGRRYRGVLESRAGDGGLQLVNEVDVEDYLRGMGEVLDPGWPAAGLQAQAIVARTYALDAMEDGRPLCSSQLCQVYVGETVEYAAMNRAVDATAGQVLTYDGSLAETVYSANGGGITATPEEGFGLTDVTYPYLKPVEYPSATPDAWELEMSWTELGARTGYPGLPSGATVSKTGPSGRALEVTVTGDGGPVAVPGLRFAEQLNLRSTLFEIRVADGAVAPGGPTGRSVTGSARARRVPVVLQAGGVGSPLGRAPWVGLAAVLVAASATFAVRVGRGRGTG
jgi:stage II sporulation protein D